MRTDSPSQMILSQAIYWIGYKQLHNTTRYLPNNIRMTLCNVYLSSLRDSVIQADQVSFASKLMTNISL